MKVNPSQLEETYIHEVLKKTCEIKNREKRIEYLKNNAFKQVKTVLQLCYNDKIQLDLPKGKPPFRGASDGHTASRLKNAFKTIKYCVVGDPTPRVKKEQIFIGILEGIHEEDALLLCAAKDGTISHHDNKTYSKITRSLVEACFPEIL